MYKYRNNFEEFSTYRLLIISFSNVGIKEALNAKTSKGLGVVQITLGTFYFSFLRLSSLLE